MDEIELLQEAANLYTVQPDEHFGAWFQAVEPLSKEESYSLSCQLEPRYHWVRKIRLFFKGKKNRSGQSECPDQQWLKPWAQETFRLSVGLGRQTAGPGFQLHC
ncbi:ral guanine nucleotide dissociation stimulator-like 1 isoform X1 [Equus asinus]|uniref:ral guanine nucleotide dissociation stimulator-like 1 isoform X1 n=1 Tax=Equus asinus TaxID=9793 RepID=UPI0038F5D283